MKMISTFEFVIAFVLITKCLAPFTLIKLSKDEEITVNAVAICSTMECAGKCSNKAACDKFGYMDSKQLCYLSHNVTVGTKTAVPEGMRVYLKHKQSNVDEVVDQNADENQDNDPVDQNAEQNNVDEAVDQHADENQDNQPVDQNAEQNNVDEPVDQNAVNEPVDQNAEQNNANEPVDQNPEQNHVNIKVFVTIRYYKYCFRVKYIA